MDGRVPPRFLRHSSSGRTFFRFQPLASAYTATASSSHIPDSVELCRVLPGQRPWNRSYSTTGMRLHHIWARASKRVLGRQSLSEESIDIRSASAIPNLHCHRCPQSRDQGRSLIPHTPRSLSTFSIAFEQIGKPPRRRPFPSRMHRLIFPRRVPWRVVQLSLPRPPPVPPISAVAEITHNPLPRPR